MSEVGVVVDDEVLVLREIGRGVDTPLQVDMCFVRRDST
jgi:hypothetical protein